MISFTFPEPLEDCENPKRMATKTTLAAMARRVDELEHRVTRLERLLALRLPTPPRTHRDS